MEVGSRMKKELTILFTTTFRFTPSYGCNLRGSNIIDVIQEGEVVDYIGEEENDWCKVKYKNVIGYILIDAMTKSNT